MDTEISEQVPSETANGTINDTINTTLDPQGDVTTPETHEEITTMFESNQTPPQILP